jgi:hypothetical protein
MISRKDVEGTLGSSIINLMFYNIKKWAIMRSAIFKNYSPFELNQIIIAFQPFFVKDNTAIDARLY